MALSAASLRAEIPIPDPAGRSVIDLGDVIAPATEQAMEQRHAALFDKTGVALVVVTVPELDGEPIEGFALRAAETWGAGRKGEDRGIVIALAVRERRVYIATGYGVEGFLNDARAGRVLDEEAVPFLRRNDFGGGLDQASAAITRIAAAEFGAEVEGLPEPAPRSNKRIPIWVIVLLVGALVVIVLFAGAAASGSSKWQGGSRGKRPRRNDTWYDGFGGGGFGRGGGGGGFGGFGGGGFGGGGAGRGF